MVHPGGVANTGFEACETTMTVTRRSPGVGAEPSVAEMVTSLADACFLWTSVMTVGAVTAKLVELVAVPPGATTEIGPVVAPEGTAVLM